MVSILRSHFGSKSSRLREALLAQLCKPSGRHVVYRAPVGRRELGFGIGENFGKKAAKTVETSNRAYESGGVAFPRQGPAAFSMHALGCQ